MLIEQGALRAAAAGRWELAAEPGDVEVPRSIRAVIGARLDALPRRDRCRSGSGRRRPRVLGRCGPASLRVQQAGDARGPRTPPCPRHPRRARDLQLLGRAGACVQARVDPRRRGGVAAEEPARRRTRRDGRLGGGASERRRDAGAPRDSLRPRAQLPRGARRAGRPASSSSPRRTAGGGGPERARRSGSNARPRAFRETLDAAAGLPVAPADLAALWEEYGHACEGVEPYAEVASAFEAALAAHQAIGDDAAAGRMEAWRAFVAFQSGDDDAVLQWSGALAHPSPRFEPGSRARPDHPRLGSTGGAGARRGRATAAARRRHRRDRRRSGDPGAGKRLARGVAAAGRVEEGLLLMEHSPSFPGRLAPSQCSSVLWSTLSEAHEEATGKYRRAEELVREGLELARRAGHRQQVAWMESNADYLLDMGRLDEAEPPIAQRPRGGPSDRRAAEIALTLPCPTSRSCVGVSRRRSIRSTSSRAHPTGPGGLRAVWVPLLEGLLAHARGLQEEAASTLLLARRQASRTEIWGAVNLLAEATRCLVRVGTASGGASRGCSSLRLPRGAFPPLPFSPGSTACSSQTRRKRAQLGNAVSAFERLERRVELGRCLIDVARVERRLESDPAPALENARDVLQDCGAWLFVDDLADEERSV